MASRTQIKDNIEHTREDISTTVDEISYIVHKRMNLKKKIRENPYAALCVAATAGFLVGALPSPFGRIIFKFAVRVASTTAFAYASTKGLSYISDIAKIS